MAFLVNNDNQEKFAIPNGETVIGRGPYLRVKEQILSRSHAVVSLNNGKVCIKPTHRNPTYFYSSDSVENCVLLEKDNWKELVDGDSISLLSGSYKYHIEITCPNVSHVTLVKSNDDKQVNAEENENGGIEESHGKPSSLDLTSNKQNVNSPSVINRAVTSSKDEQFCVKAMFDETLVSEASPNKEDEQVCANGAFETSAVHISQSRKRKLPTWMLETESAGKKKKTVQSKCAPKEAGKKTNAQRKPALPKVTSPNESPLKYDASLQPPDESNEQSISTCFSDPTTNKSPEKQITRIETSPLHESCYGIHSKYSPKSEFSFGSKIKISVADISQDEQTVAKSPVAEMSQDQQVVAKSPVAEISHDYQTVAKSPVAEISHDNQTVAKSPVAEISYDYQTVAKSPVAEIYQDEQIVLKSSIAEMHKDEHSRNSFLNDQQEKDVEEEDVKSKEAPEQQETSGKLKLCPYGKRCYRKNPAHFEEYSHDSKDDDNDVDDDSEQNSDGNIMECPYGLKCYRQNNPYHTGKFTHTSIGKQRGAHRTRRRGKKKGKSLLDKESDNDGENEYDLDDSFLASSDDSGGYSDNSSDSDYKPYGRNDDDDDDDVDELISEAKGFIRNKKM